MTAATSPALADNNDVYYGPPYWTDYVDGNFDTVDAALSAMVAKWQPTCPTCSFYFIYHDQTGPNAHQVAATISPQINTAAYGVWATAYTINPLRMAGGCDPHTGGNGGGGASAASGGSGDGSDEAKMCPGSTFAGDPINTYDGNKYQQDTDYRSSSTLTFRRFYNALSAVPSAHLGVRWRHTFDRVLELYLPYKGSDSSVAVITLDRPDGSREAFHQDKGLWIAPVGSIDILSEVKDATGVVTGYTVFMGGPKETENYSAKGLLLSVTPLSGAVTTFTYSTVTTPVAVAPKPDLLTTVTDPNGRTLSFIYDSASRIAQIILPDGGVLAYAYDSVGNLASVTYPDAGKRQYVYNEAAQTSGASLPSAMTTLIDEKGVRFETTTYNPKGQAIASSFAGGVDTFTLDPTNGKVTTPLGQSTTLTYTKAQGVAKVSGSSIPCGAACNQPFQSQTYDDNGWRTSFTDFRGNLTSASYDARGLERQRIEAKGRPEQRTTTTTWDTALRNPLTETVANASGTVVAQTGWAYNARGQAIAECHMDPAQADARAYTCSAAGAVPVGVRRTVTNYCDAVDATQCPRVGLVLSVDGPRTDVADITRYAYYLSDDESGCATVGGACHRAGDLAQVTDAMGHVQSILAYDRHGRPLRQKDANGVITDVTYTPRGWLASRTVRANLSGSASSADATTTLTYDAVGALKSVTDPDGVAVTYSYDDAHRLVDVTHGLGEHVHYTLDASGNRIKEETFDAKGVSRRNLSRSYNMLGQLVSVTDGLGHIVFDASATGSYDANGNLVTARDALGTVQKDSYDALNRLVTRVTDVNGASAETKATTTAFAFDALDQLTGITDPDGLTTTYRFDGLQNPVGQISPDTGTQSATFDVAGQPLTMTDAKGTVVSQVFDALGRTTAASYVDANLNTADYYDESDSVTGCPGSFPQGRLTRRVESAVTTAYCYDRQGRLTEQRQTQGASTDVTDYVYTQAGRLAAVASPSGLVTEYGRDGLGRIVSVTVTPAKGAPAKIVTAASYLPFGPLGSYTLGNGQTVTRTYDANYQVTDVTSPALNLHFTRDAAGNLTALGEGLGATPTTETYIYDPLYRLASVKDPSGKAIEAYTYSQAGDRSSKTAPGLATGTYGYQAGTHWLTTVGTASRAYDANGSTTANATAGVAWGYGYNGRGQLTVLQQGGSTVATYGYTAGGQRVLKTVGAAQTRYAYGPAGLLGEYGSSARDYVWLGYVPVGVVDANGVTFIHADGLDTPRAVTNGAGSTLWSWAFKRNPFGEAPPTSSEGYVLNLRFPGQYADVESGLVYNVHRYYDPTTGRYLQSDPIGLAAGPSTYLYVNANPLLLTDSLGLSWEQGGAALGCGIGGGVGSTIGAAGGGALGAAGGLACGPGAPACSTGGAAALGTAGWIAGGAAGCAGGGAAGAAVGRLIDRMCAANDDNGGDDYCRKEKSRLDEEYRLLWEFTYAFQDDPDGMQQALIRQQKIEYNRQARAHNSTCPGFQVRLIFVRDPTR